MTAQTVASDCKSPTHKAYRDAVEEVGPIQAFIIEKDLAKAQREAKEGKVVDWPRVFADAAERGAFATRAIEDATRAVNAHFDRGCRNLPESIR